jgi:1-deoxy-D-xylulose-5-phosphate synthase
VFGSPLAAALEAAERLDATVVNMRFVKPLDADCVLAMAQRHRLLITIEDNAVAGGAGSAVAELLAEHAVSTPQVMLGLPDRFIQHASREQQLAECGLDAEGIYRRAGKEIAGTIATLRAVDYHF